MGMNNYLRKGKLPNANFDMAEVKNGISNLDSAMLKVRLGSDMVVYRTCGPNTGKKFVEMKPGTVFKDKGYVSTTIRESDSYVGGGGGGNLVEIYVPKGSRAAYIRGMSHFKSEYEMLIDRDSRFMVIGQRSKVLSNGNNLNITQLMLIQ